MAEQSSVTKDIVQRIAALGRLQLSTQEIDAATDQLSRILGNFEAIQNVDTASVPTSDDVTGMVNVTRSDDVHTDALCSTDDVLAAAPRVHEGHIQVQAVFE